MAEVELSTALNSGLLTNMFLGGTTVNDKVLKSSEIDTKIKVTDDKLVDYVKTDGSISITKAVFDTLQTTPTYEESTSYYKDGVMNIQGSYPDVTLQVGREMHIEVINNTGITITNGSVVRQNSLFGELIQIVLAQADSFINATVLGMATHDIPNGQTGLVTTFGSVGDIDTSALSLGVPIYLSDTIPGTLTTTAPNIATQIGGALSLNAQGSFFVRIVNTKNLPTVLAILGGQTPGSETYTVTATQQPIDNYNLGGNILLSTDLSLGTITPFEDGVYRVSLNTSYSFSSSTSTRKLKFAIYNKTDAVELNYVIKNIPRDADEDSATLSPAVELLANKEYQFVVSTTTGTFDIVINEIVYDIESLHIR